MATAVPVRAGELIRIVTGTGGGFGNPHERSRAALESDLRNGYITQAQAASVFGYVK
jgi:N-methylhydantoinase B